MQIFYDYNTSVYIYIIIIHVKHSRSKRSPQPQPPTPPLQPTSQPTNIPLHARYNITRFTNNGYLNITKSCTLHKHYVIECITIIIDNTIYIETCMVPCFQYIII